MTTDNAPPIQCKLAGMVMFVGLALVCACGPNEGILRSGHESPSPAGSPAATSVERDVEDMRTASFDFIYVLRRRDGGPIDAEDRGVIRVQTADANRRIASDDGKAFTIGSNRQIPPDKIAVLMARFVVEDHSPPPSDQPAPGNAIRTP